MTKNTKIERFVDKYSVEKTNTGQEVLQFEYEYTVI